MWWWTSDSTHLSKRSLADGSGHHPPTSGSTHWCAGNLPRRDVDAIPHVDVRDRQHQRPQCGRVIVSCRFFPDIVRNRIGSIAEPSRCLRKRERGTLSLGEERSF